MGKKGKPVIRKEHLGTRKTCRSRQRGKVNLRTAAMSDVIDSLNNLTNEVGSAESCNEEAPRRINQFSSEGHFDEQTASSAELCCPAEGFIVSAGSTNFHLEDKGKKPEACHISGSQERETLLPATGFAMRQVAERSTLFDSCEEKMGEDDDSQVLKDIERITLFDSCEEKMGEDDDSQVVKDITFFYSHDEKRDVGSQSSHEKMREYGGLDRGISEDMGQDMGDADSDIIYLEGLPSLDEMEDDFCDDMLYSMSAPDYYLEDSGEEDGGSEPHHDFDENTAEDADACEEPQRMELDDGSAAFKEIDAPSSEASFPCPEEHERIRELGTGTHVQSKKLSSVSWYSFPELPHINSYHRSSNVMPIEVYVFNEKATEFDIHEEKFKGSDFSTLFGLLDDRVEVEFERGNVRRWACVDFSSLSHKMSLRLIDSFVNACVAIGMKFYLVPLMLARVKPATWDDIKETLLDMHKKIIDFYTKREEEDSEVFLLVILPNDGKYNEKIEVLCGTLEVAYELCYPEFVDDIFKLELRETARKIQSKVVKRDVRRRRSALPLVSDAPMIIFGADLFHCIKGERSESIATVAASLDWPKFRKYFVKESNQPCGEEIIKDLHNSNGGIMIDFFNSFYKRIKRCPQKIIFFRNGLERGNFGSICQQEIDAIKRACAHFNSTHQPQLTYVVVFPTPFHMIEPEITDQSNGNIPGTEADHTKFKFWCCHRGQNDNTSSLVCYYVVHDDNNFRARELQSLTSKLCTFRHRWANPEIDMVPPAYYAQSAALDAVQEWIRKTS